MMELTSLKRKIDNRRKNENWKKRKEKDRKRNVIQFRKILTKDKRENRRENLFASIQCYGIDSMYKFLSDIFRFIISNGLFFSI